MAGPPESLPADTLSLFVLTHQLMTAASAFILYEYVISMNNEVEFVWKSRPGASSILLLSLRWTLLAQAVMILLPSPSIEECSTRTVIQLVPTLLGLIQTAVFSALRVFAISDHNRYVFGVVLLLGLTPVVLNTHALIKHGVPVGYISKRVQDSFVCNPPTPELLTAAIGYAYGGRLPLIISESLVVGLTWAKTYRVFLTGHRLGVASSLTTCLLRDGSLYFIIFLIINVASIVLLMHPTTGPISPVLDIIPPVLTARFIMNLRFAAVTPSYSAPPQMSRHTLCFAQAQPISTISWAAVDELGGSVDLVGRPASGISLDAELSALNRQSFEEDSIRSYAV